MKVLLLLFLVGCATAFVVQNKLDDAVEQEEFLLELERAEAKTEVGKELQKVLDGLLEKIKDEVEKGKAVKEELIEKLKEVREKLKELKMDIGHKARELIKTLKEKSDDFWNYILGKEETYIQAADFNVREMLKKLKETIIAKIDKEKLKAKIEEIFGKGSEMADSFLEIINEKGDKYKQKLLDLVDRFLGKDESIKRKRSIKEYWEKIKEYFKDLHIDLSEKYMKFGEWVKEYVGKGIDKGKSKLENIRNIAKEFIDHTKGVSKEVAVEAREFLRPYQKDLGSLWDQVKDTVKDILNKKD